nr:hypothetical protein [uncultured Allomuricauda sp.]
MKKIVLFTTMFLISNSFATAQTISLKEVERGKKELNERKKEDSIELNIRVKEYLQFDESDKKSKGFYALERYNYNYQYYPYLKMYSDTLAPVLFKYYKKNSVTRKALGLLELPQFMKDSLLAYDKTEEYIKAALGDSISEKNIINSFNNINAKDLKTIKQRDLFYDLAFSLLYINSKNTIKAFLKGMESDKIDKDLESNLPEDLKFHESRFASLLGVYSSIYEYEYITSVWHNGRFDGLKKRTKEMEIYFKELEEYFFNEYNIKITINPPFLQYGELEIIEDQIIEDPNKN